jgi:hypothetical protein
MRGLNGDSLRLSSPGWKGGVSDGESRPVYNSWITAGASLDWGTFRCRFGARIRPDSRLVRLGTTIQRLCKRMTWSPLDVVLSAR